VKAEYRIFGINGDYIQAFVAVVVLGVAGAMYTARLNTRDLGRPAPGNLYAPAYRTEISYGLVKFARGSGTLRVYDNTLSMGHTSMWIVGDRIDGQRASTEMMRIQVDGRVMIGGTTPESALAIMEPGGKVRYNSDPDSVVRHLIEVIKESTKQNSCFTALEVRPQ
jgi:hypothetical protein